MNIDGLKGRRSFRATPSLFFLSFFFYFVTNWTLLKSREGTRAIAAKHIVSLVKGGEITIIFSSPEGRFNELRRLAGVFRDGWSLIGIVDGRVDYFALNGI